MSESVDVFSDNKSFIRLVDWVGDELAIVNAARVSFHNESTWIETSGESHFSSDNPNDAKIWEGSGEKVLNSRDKGLLNFLLKNRHGSPFEHGFMAQFHIRLPIFVMREWVRHRIGHSINEESGRYVELRPDFYIPQKLRQQTGKPGNYTFTDWVPSAPEDEFAKFDLEKFLIEAIEESSVQAFDTYKYLLNKGVAKEQARIVLPLNLYTEIRWTCNARSLMNFLSLRNSPDAMYEIRRYAEEIEKIFAQHMPNVHSSFVNNNRIAP